MANLASTYWNQGRWKEAEELDVQHGQPGLYLEILGRVEDAVILMKPCVQLRSKQLGRDHPDTLSSSQALSEWQQLDSSSSNKLPQAPGQPESDPLPPQVSEHLAAVSIANRPSEEHATEPSKSEPETIRH
ncbi:hypothetical protein GX51_08326 [Blastomyces parvus]|uniref:Kinesin light chain n=1 Tax=Blastomyces parvus TaxID=2060905 RepID=A0A2B7WEN6_9EURO|nr:hypothetical protein GX51_08326 [Blastomyces parvus]